MLAHKDYPYATKSEKNILVKKTGLTESQITMYMSNWRRRHLSLNDRKPFKRSLYYYWDSDFVFVTNISSSYMWRAVVLHSRCLHWYEYLITIPKFKCTFLTFQWLLWISWFRECCHHFLKQCVNIHPWFCRHFNIHCLHLSCLLLSFLCCHFSNVNSVNKGNRVSTRSILFPTSKTRQSQCWLATSAYHCDTLLNDNRSTLLGEIRSYLSHRRR